MSTYKRPEADKLKSCLTKLQYNVTQKGETEQPFNNEFWDNKEEGIYVDVVSGEPLFSSSDKYDSGSGWPSFTRPLVKENLVEKSDHSISYMERTELRSKHGDSHLGHVFDDGPMPTGKRFCINSASLRFVPKEKLEKEGYGQFNNLFTEQKVTEGDTETIYLAGGCFWGMEELLRKMEGMVEVEVGYAGGITKNPTYEEVKTGRTGHAESVKLVFNPNHLSLEELLLFFFRIHDPTTQNRQGNDIGSQYRSAIFYVSENQKEAAVRIMKDPRVTERWKKPLVTELTAFTGFYPAESYHQDYLQKHPDGYTCHYERP